MKNITKTTKVSLLAIVALASITLMGMNNAEATNWNNRVWDDDTIRYKCISVSGITKTANVDPCGDLTTSSNYWEVSGSTLTINEVTSGAYEIPVYAWTSMSDVGLTSLNWDPVTGEFNSGYVVLNKNLDWEDTPTDTSTDGYDWITATGHEFGHVAGLKDYTNQYYLMYTPLGENNENRYTTSHSRSHLSGNYAP